MNKFTPLKKRFEDEKIVISIRLEEKLLNQIDNLANQTDISRNEFIIQCIKYALTNMETKNTLENRDEAVFTKAS